MNYNICSDKGLYGFISKYLLLCVKGPLFYILSFGLLEPESVMSAVIF